MRCTAHTAHARLTRSHVPAVEVAGRAPVRRPGRRFGEALTRGPARERAERIAPDGVICGALWRSAEGNRADRRGGVEVLELAPEALELNPVRVILLDAADMRERAACFERPGDLAALEGAIHRKWQPVRPEEGDCRRRDAR